jgi:hypothetical protein
LKDTTMTHVPSPTVIFLVPTAGTGWLRKIKPVFPPPAKSRNPNRPVRPIPAINRDELRERVHRYLKQTQPYRREQLRAAAEQLYPCAA